MSSSKKKTSTVKAAATVKLTPKQASIASANLLRGLDNAIKDNQRNLAKLEGMKSKVGVLSAGLSNLATAPTPAPKAQKAQKAPPAKPAAKAAPKAAKTKAPAKAAPKPAAKAQAKPAKAAPKPAKAAKAATEAPQADKPPVSGRPSAREAIKEFLTANGGRMATKDLKEAIKAKYGYYSAQTFYDSINKDGELSHADGYTTLTPKADKVDDLVRRVEQDRSTASVV